MVRIHILYIEKRICAQNAKKRISLTPVHNYHISNHIYGKILENHSSHFSIRRRKCNKDRNFNN